MNKIKIISCALLCILLLGGCGSKVPFELSKEVEQNRIFQSYKVEYHADTKAFSASAAFSIDNASGTAVKLSGSSITLNDKELSWSRNGEYTYSSTNLPKDVTFIYRNNKKKNFINKPTINELSIPQKSIILDKNIENTISVEGNKFEDQETVLLILVKNDEITEVETYAEEHHVIIDTEFLATVKNGTYKAYFIRKNYSSDIQSTDRGGVWESSYFSLPLQVTVK